MFGQRLSKIDPPVFGLNSEYFASTEVESKALPFLAQDLIIPCPPV
jgi:hypothetical protein